MYGPVCTVGSAVGTLCLQPHRFTVARLLFANSQIARGSQCHQIARGSQCHLTLLAVRSHFDFHQECNSIHGATHTGGEKTALRSEVDLFGNALLSSTQNPRFKEHAPTDGNLPRHFSSSENHSARQILQR